MILLNGLIEPLGMEFLELYNDKYIKKHQVKLDRGMLSINKKGYVMG